MSDPWQKLVASGRVRANVSLGDLTTYKLGGPASLLVEAKDRETLVAVSQSLQEAPIPVLVLGRGSNLVVSDEGFAGLVIRLGGDFGKIDVGPRVAAGGAVGMPQVARAATAQGQRGLEFLIGIPGSVGGGVRQNAGCFGSEVVDVLQSAEIFELATGVLATVGRNDLAMTYRQTNVSPTQLVLKARFSTEAGDAGIGGDLIREITRWRRLNQPGGTLNAGSVFKNPPGDSAGRIIDSLGLKGTTVGRASVSEKHANFFVAMPGTKAIDVYLLVKKVAAVVRERAGIELEPEIQFAGRFLEEGDYEAGH